ncbi:MAG: transcription termination/antitermination protein NusG [Sphaerochaetaceae bacterium]|jgi:transcriptional antiterminator NusG|nr:transcription termination/antitermination protein NusG [Sphaerochaetaceae bacterium]MDD3366738.1 transcription termination/antitermination protein NusG [Sphaerochaetaceae bacterium]MDD4219208.1 transcription termination/antitermination protein NusG [Sphaerochaetaceae bacterium]MDY0370988.1 transcription termination/antitermination protein NusG [Sphaerochaetaceae bacterium]
MAKGWYVVHTYSGYENKIEKIIHKMMESDPQFGEVVSDVKVPIEEVIEVKDGVKKTVKRKILPSYILVQMDLPEYQWEFFCSQIKKIQGVTGFVGSLDGRKPTPLTSEELKGILQKTGEIKTEKVLRPKQSFSQGEHVKIVEGPFESFTGTIEEVNLEKGRLRVLVGIFGRSTPVEVDFLEVEKI